MSDLTAGQRQAHELADAAGELGYFDPETGLFVMTRSYLMGRGTCCSTGCRHCPYGGPSKSEINGDA